MLSPGLSLVLCSVVMRQHPAVIQRLKTFQWAVMFVLEDIPLVNKLGW